jgi:hypothetical protein
VRFGFAEIFARALNSAGGKSEFIQTSISFFPLEILYFPGDTPVTFLNTFV